MKFRILLAPRPLFYQLSIILSGLFLLAFPLPWLLLPSQIALAVLLSLTAMDAAWVMWNGYQIALRREVATRLSLNSDNPIGIWIDNQGARTVHLELLDELPEQLQIRNFKRQVKIAPRALQKVEYTVKPQSRGEYHFGEIHALVKSPLGLFTRHFRFSEPMMCAVYPSVIEMKALELRTFTRLAHLQGIRKLRRIGHTYEFEQIREYVKGDEYRSINWKATGRKAELMVNQFTDEKSQQVVHVIDVSRSMFMPFDGLRLVDYAVNTTLALSNIALRKEDKTGLIHISARHYRVLPPDRSRQQLQRIQEALYKLKIEDLEPNLELLYSRMRRDITQRSLVFLYTNFESVPALERALSVLRQIRKHHLLVVVFFENAEVRDLAEGKAQDLAQVYSQTLARKYLTARMQMIQMLQQHGIQTVFNKPADLSINTLNKYLELKSRGLI